MEVWRPFHCKLENREDIALLCRQRRNEINRIHQSSQKRIEKRELIIEIGIKLIANNRNIEKNWSTIYDKLQEI